MRRADRLFQLIEILRRKRVTTAKQLAQTLEVSERTIYRDIRDLISSGVPIEGEAGVGYVLEAFDLPPLMFDQDEIEALAFGMRMVQTWGDSELAHAAERALGKVQAVLPEERQHLVEATPLFAPAHFGEGLVRFDIAGLRHAIRERRYVRVSYVDYHGAATERRLRPLAMVFLGQVWLLTAWCELRDDFRAFRPDRIKRLEVLEERFPDEPGKRLQDYVVLQACDDGAS